MENEPTVVYVLFFTDSLYSKLCKVKHFGRNSIWFRRDRQIGRSKAFLWILCNVDAITFEVVVAHMVRHGGEIKSELVKMQEQRGTGELEWQVKKWFI